MINFSTMQKKQFISGFKGFGLLNNVKFGVGLSGEIAALLNDEVLMGQIQ